MREVSDAFLLNVAEVSATLIGLFVVGIFFYVGGENRRLEPVEAVESYFRAGTRIVIIVFAIPLGLSLTLVVLEPIWSSVLFVLLSLALIAANVDTASRIRAFAKAAGPSPFVLNEVAGSVLTVVIVVIPWVLGGLHPSREDFTWAILLALLGGFLSTISVVMSVFARPESAAGSGAEGMTGERPGEPAV